MAKPYKIFELYKMHDCESKTGWVEISGTLAIDTDCQENKYSLKLVGSETESDVTYLYTTPIDLSIFTHLRFFIKGEDCTLRIYLYDSVNNYDYWNISMPQTSWILNTEVIATPDGNSGTVDYTDIKAIRFFIVEHSKTIYFDYIIAYKDITDDAYAPQVHRKVYEVSKGYFKSTLDISDDHCIEIYDENDNLKFEGNIQERSYGNIKEYKLIGFDAVIGDKVSGDYTDSTIETIAKALIDQVSYLRYITGSITTVAGNHTIKITERPFIEQLRKLADLFDGIGYISPDGVVYLDDGSTQCSEPEIFEATYNFMDEVVGTTGTDITFIDTDNSGDNCVASIISDWQGHKKVLQLYDNNNDGRIDIEHDFSASQSADSIDFYWGTNDALGGRSYVRLYEDGNERIVLKLDVNDFSYHDGDNFIKVYESVADDIIYRHKVIFICATNTFTWTIRDPTGAILYNGAGLSFKSNATVLTKLGIDTGTPESDFYTYFDAWGESWDTQYTVGDNINGFVSNGKYGLLANNPLLEQIGLPINQITAYGKMDMDTGARLKGTANNTASQKLHGIVPFSVRAPHINTQAEIDAFATTTLSRKGLTNSPKEIKLLKLINLYNLDALFIGRTIAFKLDAKSYTIYDYICLETYWRGESSILELYLSSGLLHSSEQDVDDSTIDEGQQDETGEESYETDINTISPFLLYYGGATADGLGVLLDGVDEGISFGFFIDSKVDDSRDMLLTITWFRSDNNNDTVTVYENMVSCKADGSEAESTIIDGNEEWAACAQSRHQKRQITIAAADLNIGDDIWFNCRLKEAARQIIIKSLALRYYVKRE